MQVPITKLQHALYEQAKATEAAATQQVNLILGVILAGHGIAEGQVLAVTPEGITLSDPPDE